MRFPAVILIAAALLPLPILLAKEDDALAKALALRDNGQFESAMEALEDLLEARPDDPVVLLELARTARAHAAEIMVSASPTLGRLALFDAVKWCERAVAAAPGDVVALRLLGACNLEMAEYGKAADAYRRAAELDPGDGESLYQLGFALAYQRNFAEAIDAFNRAERILGPDSRIHLNRGISLESLGQKADAEREFLKLVEREVAAGTPGSDPVRRAWVWLWRIHTDAGDFDSAETLFARLAGEHPTLTSPWWYLAHARQAKGDTGGAADAFAKVVEISPGYLEGWRLLGGALVAAKRYDEAVTALETQLPLDPGGEGARDLLISIARGMGDAGRRDEAVELLKAGEGDFPEDSLLLEARADLEFAAGRMTEAIRAWRRAAELDPFAAALLVKEQKAATVLLREGRTPQELLPLRPEPGEERGAGDGGTILDFETSEVFARVNGAAEGYRERGEFVLKRKGDPAGIADLGLTLVPTLDTRPFTTLAFRVNGTAGTVMSIWAMDGYDEFTVAPGMVRLVHETPVGLTGEWQDVALPLDGFRSVVPSRPIPPNRARLRMLLFEIGRGTEEGQALAEEVRIDDVRLTSGAGDPLVLADFDDDPSETIFLSDGVATAFVPLLATMEQVAGFRAGPNTFVRPEILGDEFDPAMVHSGRGSFRLTLVGEGAAAGALSFNPDRSYESATAITFWARGETGGEKLRIEIRDALDDALGNPAPALAPRHATAESEGTGPRIREGRIVLTKDWRRYTIPRAAFPDVDFESLASLRFLFGTPEGNPVGTRLYLDDIRWE